MGSRARTGGGRARLLQVAPVELHYPVPPPVLQCSGLRRRACNPARRRRGAPRWCEHRGVDEHSQEHTANRIAPPRGGALAMSRAVDQSSLHALSSDPARRPAPPAPPCDATELIEWTSPPYGPPHGVQSQSLASPPPKQQQQTNPRTGAAPRRPSAHPPPLGHFAAKSPPRPMGSACVNLHWNDWGGRGATATGAVFGQMLTCGLGQALLLPVRRAAICSDRWASE